MYRSRKARAGDGEKQERWQWCTAAQRQGRGEGERVARAMGRSPAPTGAECLRGYALHCRERLHRSQLPREYIKYLTKRRELIRKKLPCSAAQRNPPGPKTGEQMGEETRAIVAKMEELLNDAEEQRRCIGALMNLKDKPSDTLSPGPAMPIIEAGAVKATIKAMEKHRRNADVQSAGCRMLYMFCSNHVDDKVKAAIVEDTDVSKVLVAALKAHSGDAKVARWCIAALAYATQNKSTHALLLKDKKTLDNIVAAMGDFRSAGDRLEEDSDSEDPDEDAEDPDEDEYPLNYQDEYDLRGHAIVVFCNLTEVPTQVQQVIDAGGQSVVSELLAALEAITVLQKKDLLRSDTRDDDHQIGVRLALFVSPELLWRFSQGVEGLDISNVRRALISAGAVNAFVLATEITMSAFDDYGQRYCMDGLLNLVDGEGFEDAFIKTEAAATVVKVIAYYQDDDCDEFQRESKNGLELLCTVAASSERAREDVFKHGGKDLLETELSECTGTPGEIAKLKKALGMPVQAVEEELKKTKAELEKTKAELKKTKAERDKLAYDLSEERGKKAPARSPAPAPRKKNGAAAAANASPAKKQKTSPVVMCVNPETFDQCLKAPKNSNPGTVKTLKTCWRKHYYHYTLLKKIPEQRDRKKYLCKAPQADTEQTYNPGEGNKNKHRGHQMRLEQDSDKNDIVQGFGNQPLMCPNCWQKFIDPVLEDDSADEDE